MPFLDEIPLLLPLQRYGVETALHHVTECVQLISRCEWELILSLFVFADDLHALVELLEEQLQLLDVLVFVGLQDVHGKVLVDIAEEGHVGRFTLGRKQVLEGLQY